MTHSELTELQIEISELEKENQELRSRIQELEVNFAYVEQQLSERKETPKAIFSESVPKLSVVSA